METRQMICTQCGSVGPPRTWNAGHIVMIFLLAIFGVFPGLGYAFALSLRFPECRACGARRSMIPLGTPAARALLQRQRAQENSN